MSSSRVLSPVRAISLIIPTAREIETGRIFRLPVQSQGHAAFAVGDGQPPAILMLFNPFWTAVAEIAMRIDLIVRQLKSPTSRAV